MRPASPSSSRNQPHSRPAAALAPALLGLGTAAHPARAPVSPSWTFSSASISSQGDSLRSSSFRDPMPRPEAALSGAVASSYRTALDAPAPVSPPISASARPVSSGTFGPRGGTLPAAAIPGPPSSSGRYDDATAEHASLDASLLRFEAQVTPPTDASAITQEGQEPGSGTTSGWVRAQVAAQVAAEVDSRAGDFPDSDYTFSRPAPPHAPELPAESLPSFLPSFPPGFRPPLRESPPSYPRAHPFNRGSSEPRSPGSINRVSRIEYPQPQYLSSYASNSGSSWQQLGVGFDPSPLTELPASGGRAARLQARRERLEKRQARAREEGEVEGGGTPREIAGEYLRRVEGREVDWSGADDKGRLLVSRWPKVWRWFAAGLALMVLVGLLAADVVASPTTAPPQKHKVTIYALWAMPFLSWLLAGYCHLLRPYLYRKRTIAAALAAARHGGPTSLASLTLLSQQVPPMSSSVSGGGSCCSRRANKPPPGMSKQEWAMRQRMPAQPTINLVVHPGVLTGLLTTPSDPAAAKTTRRAARREAQATRKRRAARERRRAVADAAGRDEDEAWDSDTTDSSSENGSDEGKPDGPEQQAALHKWTNARSWAAKVAAVEFVWGLLWLVAVGAAIAVGGTCSEGAYDGWCLYYNFGLAMAVLCALAWLACAGLGIKTLRRTRSPPSSQQASARLLA